MTEDEDLARRMRAGLERRAGEADTSAPVADRARAAARRRRGARVAGLTAAAVAAVAVTGFLVDRSASPGGGHGPGVVDEPGGVVTGTWRTEYWRDLQVDVPADWGYGGAPEDLGDGDTMACGAVAVVSATGERLLNGDPAMPYVGRPIAQTDVCQLYPWIGPNDSAPPAPYVWLGAAVEPGTVDLGGGYTQVTREVNGSTLTVATRDDDLRARILDSATGGETCFSELESAPDPAATSGPGEGASPVADPDANPDAGSLTVCAYRRDESGLIGLVYAADLSRERTRDFVAAARNGEHDLGRTCDLDGTADEWVLLSADGSSLPAGQAFDGWVVALGTDCSVLGGGGSVVELTPAMVEPWAVGGIPAVLYGPTGGRGAMIDSFIGPLG